MKTRHGFVSNSSSSSFIIGYGTIIDEEAFDVYCNKNNIKYSNHKDTKEWCWSDVTLIDSNLLTYQLRVIVGGNNSQCTIPVEDNYDFPDIKKILRVEITNNEGDEPFSVYDTNGRYVELNYSKALKPEFYSKEQQSIIKLFDQDFIKDCYYDFGGDRNG